MNFLQNKMRRLGAMAAFSVLASVISVNVNAETTIKLAHTEGEGDLLENPHWVYTQVFNSELEKGTNGEYKLQVFPNKQMGDNPSITEQVARGIIQMGMGMSIGDLASHFPAVQVLEAPYTFASTDEARRVLNGPFGDEMSEAAAESAGIRILSYLPAAFRNFSSSEKLIKSPADMVGQKIRVQPIPSHLKLVESLGALPTPIEWAELYNALQTGVVDGQENAPYTMLLANLHETQKYYTLDKHLLNLPVAIINENFYQSMSDEGKEVLHLAARDAALTFLGIVKATESQDLKEIADAGVEIYSPTPEEFQEFVDASRQPVRELIQESIDSGWFEKLDNAIDHARSEVSKQ